MRHNNRPHIAISALPVHTYALVFAGEDLVAAGLKLRKQEALAKAKPAPSVVCPWCHRWELLERRMLVPHCWHGQRHHGCREGNCPGSGQRYVLDVGFQDWSNQLAAAVQDTDTRSSKRPCGFPKGYISRDPAPPVPVPLCRPVPAASRAAA